MRTLCSQDSKTSQFWKTCTTLQHISQFIAKLIKSMELYEVCNKYVTKKRIRWESGIRYITIAITRWIVRGFCIMISHKRYYVVSMIFSVMSLQFRLQLYIYIMQLRQTTRLYLVVSRQSSNHVEKIFL